jgi:hypothetical protein
VRCDVCGGSASETVAIELEDEDFEKDLCAQHLAELLRGAWVPPRRHLGLIPSPEPVDPTKPTHLS